MFKCKETMLVAIVLSMGLSGSVLARVSMGSSGSASGSGSSSASSSTSSAPKDKPKPVVAAGQRLEQKAPAKPADTGSRTVSIAKTAVVGTAAVGLAATLRAEKEEERSAAAVPAKVPAPVVVAAPATPAPAPAPAPMGIPSVPARGRSDLSAVPAVIGAPAVAAQGLGGGMLDNRGQAERARERERELERVRQQERDRRWELERERDRVAGLEAENARLRRQGQGGYSSGYPSGYPSGYSGAGRSSSGMGDLRPMDSGVAAPAVAAAVVAPAKGAVVEDVPRRRSALALPGTPPKPEEESGNGWLWLLGGCAVAGGVGFVVWRRSQGETANADVAAKVASSEQKAVGSGGEASHAVKKVEPLKGATAQDVCEKARLVFERVQLLNDECNDVMLGGLCEPEVVRAIVEGRTGTKAVFSGLETSVYEDNVEDVVVRFRGMVSEDGGPSEEFDELWTFSKGDYSLKVKGIAVI